MDNRKLQQLGKVVYSQSLHQIRRDLAPLRTEVFGFDTEYDSESRELISVQLSYQGQGKIIPINTLNWISLYELLKNFADEQGISLSYHKVSTIRLISFWTVAEAQFLDTLSPKIKIDEWGSGNYDFSFPVKTHIYIKCPLCGAKQEIENGICDHCFYEGRFHRKEYNRQVLQIVDLQTFFRGQGLASVAKQFGFTKLDYDRKHITKDCLNDPAFRAYAMNDAIITEGIYRKLRDVFLGEWKIDVCRTKTPANTSMAIFRRHFLSEEIGNPNTILRRLIMLASWGGNNQAFCRGIFRGDFREYDAKSMYPNSVIALGTLPIGKTWRFAKTLDEFLDPANVGGVCEVDFQFPKDCFVPCLPVMIQGSLCYPSQGRTYCTLEEVRLAVRLGADMRFIRGYYYREGVTDLSRYMQVLMSKKDSAEIAGDMVRRSLYKLMANSIIGKFSQKIVSYDMNEIRKKAEELEIPLQTLMNMKGLEKLGISKKVNLGSGFLPEWNCLILGYARSVLAQAFAENADRVMAGTTDSLIVTGEMKNKVIRGIHFEEKGRGDFLAVVRTRLYLLANSDTQEIRHIAFHGLRSQEKAFDILFNGLFVDNFSLEYLSKHIIKYRESIRNQDGWKLGEEIVRNMHISLAWDGKRQLIPIGNGNFSSIPLSSCELCKDMINS